MDPRQEKTRVFALAAKLFGRLGYEAVELEDIAKIARLDKAAVTRLAFSKEDLFFQVLTREVTTLVEQAEQGLAHGVAVPDTLIRRLATDAFSLAEERPLVRGLMVGRFDEALPAWKERLHELRMRCLAVPEQVLRVGIARKLLRPDLPVELTAQLLLELHVMGYLYVATGPDAEERAAERRRIAVEIILRGVKHPALPNVAAPAPTAPTAQAAVDPKAKLGVSGEKPAVVGATHGSPDRRDGFSPAARPSGEKQGPAKLAPAPEKTSAVSGARVVAAGGSSAKAAAPLPAKTALPAAPSIPPKPAAAPPTAPRTPRDRLLDAAGKIARERGYAAVFLEGVAEAAGVEPPADITDRYELLFAVLARDVAEVVAEARSGMQGVSSAMDQFRAVSDRSFEAIQARPLVVTLLTGAAADALPGREAELSALVQQLADTIVPMLEAGIAQKIFRDDLPIDLVARVLFELHMAGHLLHYRPGADLKLRALQRRVAALDLVFRGIALPT